MLTTPKEDLDFECDIFVVNNKEMDLFLFMQDHCTYKRDTGLKKAGKKKLEKKKSRKRK